MTEKIAALLAYQNADLAVDKAEAAVLTSDERKKAVSMKKKYENAVEERKKLLAMRATAAEELKQISDEVEKLSGLAAVDRTVDAPEDVDSINSLVNDLTKILGQLKKQEERINAINGKITDNEKKINDYTVFASKVKDEFNANKEKYDKMVSEAKPEIEKLKKERDRLAESVDKQLLNKYMSLKKSKVLPPVVLLNGERCDGCKMGMPSFTVSNANKNGYCECENCGRIAYTE